MFLGSVRVGVYIYGTYHEMSVVHFEKSKASSNDTFIAKERNEDKLLLSCSICVFICFLVLQGKPVHNEAFEEDKLNKVELTKLIKTFTMDIVIEYNLEVCPGLDKCLPSNQSGLNPVRSHSLGPGRRRVPNPT